MAQVQEERMTWARRCRLYARQRPVVLVIGAVVATLSIMALGAGVTGALGAAGAGDGGVLVTRSEAGSSEQGAAGAENDDTAPDDGGASGGGASGSEGKPEKPEVIVVDVAGAVGAPSLVTLQADSRVGDAIEAAGGFAADADAARVNRAAKLQDGQQVYVPRVGEAGGGGSGAVAPDVGASAQGVATADGPVNINRASESDLDALPGVGPSTARAIVEDRDANGPFSTIEDLMRVSGIGEKKFEKLKSSICV